MRTYQYKTSVEKLVTLSFMVVSLSVGACLLFDFSPWVLAAAVLYLMLAGFSFPTDYIIFGCTTQSILVRKLYGFSPKRYEVLLAPVKICGGGQL